MSIFTTLSLILLVRGLSMNLPSVEGATGINEVSPGATAMIALTILDVNDQTLKLRYKIMNRSDHDIWVCEAVGIFNKPSPDDYEVYMDSDALSLVIAKRIEGPMQLMYVRPPSIEGRYVRLRPGQERIDSLSLGVPIKRHTLFTSIGLDIAYATRLLLKIGYYDKDLASGKDIEQVVVTYRRTAYLSGDERSLGITIEGVLIPVGRIHMDTSGIPGTP